MNNCLHYTRTSVLTISVIIVVTFITCCRISNQSQARKTAGNQRNDNVVIDRSGNHYAVKSFPDNNMWIVSNLKLIVPGSYYYNDSAGHEEQYGRLYTWEAAQNGCASLGEGWRLPTKEDWRQLAEKYGAIGREETNIAKRAFSPLLTGGNAQFNAVLGGGRNPDGSYARLEAHGFYWTISQQDSATAWFANFAKGSQALYLQPDGEKIDGFSVRCVKSTPR
jgi:uncharacterized protein (TIGR02145 family)